MAMQTINPTYTTVKTRGRAGGGGLGSAIGGVVGGTLGGLAGLVTGGWAVPAGAVAGAAGGAGIGQLIGNSISPQKAGSETTIQNPTVGLSTFTMALQSQALLDGIRAAQDHPTLASEYSDALTRAYVGSMVRLKRRG